jgi:hypothetical protein
MNGSWLSARVSNSADRGPPVGNTHLAKGLAWPDDRMGELGPVR